MIDDFLRRPHTITEWAADGIRILGILSVLVAFVWLTPTDAGILALALPALMVPRFAGARAGFDLGYGAAVVIATWSNVLDLYRTVAGWDLVMHFVTTGMIAAMAYLVLRRTRVVPGPDAPARVPIVLVTTIGLAVCVVWEVIEWAGKTFVTDEIFVTYQDTIGDMIVGGAGGLVAAVAVSLVRIERMASTPEREDARWLRI
ncbi:hypothetical protein AB3M83_07780 [Microbacterium sp. 179-B 1A2 NHS]|uniref:hypothetical protein n=1 Tax=Microbacterium sp. 179-B 1A2 NHS TaxID=3142383 RepID=UPI0039A1802B